MCSISSVRPGDSDLGKHFGTEVENYEKGRKPLPKEIFQWIKGLVKKSDAPILDVACGSGRATLPLYKHVSSKVTGVDTDGRMLAIAKAKFADQKCPIALHEGEVKNLSTLLPNAHFDAVTASSAIHWFGLQEKKAIHSALNPGGVFFIIGGSGKNGGKSNGNADIAEVLGKETAKQKTDQKQPFNAQVKAELEQIGFKLLEEKQFHELQEYTFEEACAEAKSKSLYASLSKEDKEKVWPAIEQKLKDRCDQDGKIRRERSHQCYAYVKISNQPAPVAEAGKKDAVMSETTRKALRITAFALAILAAVGVLGSIVVGCIVFPPASGLFFASLITGVASTALSCIASLFSSDDFWNIKWGGDGLSNEAYENPGRTRSKYQFGD